MANMERMRVGGFFEPNTREDCAAGFAGAKDVYTDQAGIVRCRKCNKPRMFYLAEARRWLPCACGCKDAYAQEEARAIEADRREQSGIIGRYADALILPFPSIGFPRGSTTLPRNSSPTGLPAVFPVLLTEVPSKTVASKN